MVFNMRDLLKAMISLQRKYAILKLVILINFGLTIIYQVLLYSNSRKPSIVTEKMKPFAYYVVPNIVHFVRFGPKPLTFIDAVCILAASKNQNPDKIYVHSNLKNFTGGKYWDIVIKDGRSKKIIVKYLEMPEHIYGQKFKPGWKYYHASDVERLKILMKYGGIYLDNDSYLVKSLDEFRRYEMTLGWEEAGGISDQVIIANSKARFLKIWLESYKNYKMDSWFYNAGELPTEILKQSPHLVHRENRWLAEYRTIPYLVYLESSNMWKVHYVIHLLINHQYTIGRNLSHEATYPVVFNETNIQNYPVNIKDMVLDVYPFQKSKTNFRKRQGPRKNYKMYTLSKQ